MLWLGFATLVCLAYGGFVGGKVALAFAERLVSIAERRTALLEQRAKSQVPPIIPPELMRRILKWEDPSAQESERAAILSLYDEFRDHENPWSQVKRHLAPEPDERFDSPLLS